MIFFNRISFTFRSQSVCPDCGRMVMIRIHVRIVMTVLTVLHRIDDGSGSRRRVPEGRQIRIVGIRIHGRVSRIGRRLRRRRGGPVVIRNGGRRVGGGQGGSGKRGRPEVVAELRISGKITRLAVQTG